MRQRIRRFRLFVVAALFFPLASCGGLPGDFSKLPLDQKITAYENHFNRFGSPLDEACSWISWHGLPAARSMIVYLSGQDDAIPWSEALRIVRFVQLRGCPLAGTDVHEFLANLNLDQSLGEDERSQLSTVIREIEEDLIVGGDKLDGIPDGPCSPSVQGEAM